MNLNHTGSIGFCPLQVLCRATWVMLLQLDSDKAVNWQWGDDGAIYFWIPVADFAEGRFNRAWVVLQSP
jgi:uncharacterized protein YwqG